MSFLEFPVGTEELIDMRSRAKQWFEKEAYMERTIELLKSGVMRTGVDNRSNFTSLNFGTDLVNGC